MKTLSNLLFVLFLIFTANTAIALSGSVSTDLYLTKSGALKATEKLVEDIQEGRNLLSYEDFLDNCQSRSSDLTTHIDFAIKSVWVYDQSGVEKKYYGLVGFNLQCFAQNRP